MKIKNAKFKLLAENNLPAANIKLMRAKLTCILARLLDLKSESWENTNIILTAANTMAF